MHEQKKKDKSFERRKSREMISLYSRQLFIMGIESIKTLTEARVLIVNLRDVGTEVAKNLALVGIGLIGVCDTRKWTESDVNLNTFLAKAAKMNKIKTEIARTVEPYIAELNWNVKVQLETDISPEVISRYDLVVCCEMDSAEIMIFNESVREAKKKFVAATQFGVCGYIFSDLLNHTIVDTDGEERVQGMLHYFEPAKIAITADQKKHELMDGDIIRVYRKEVDYGEYSVVVKNYYSFIPYKKETGIVGEEDLRVITEVFYEKIKENKHSSFVSYIEAKNKKLVEDRGTVDPLFVHKMLSEYRREETLGEMKMRLIEYIAENKQERLSDAQKKVFNAFWNTKDGGLPSVVSIIGGIAAQEAMKGITGKHTPISQFLYYTCEELFYLANDVISEEDIEKTSEKEEKTHKKEEKTHKKEEKTHKKEEKTSEKEEKAHDRYEKQRKIIGDFGVEAIRGASVFMVGAGAIGCEHLKNLALLGVGTRGKITVTDMDNIEMSNLSRQFLFKRKDIGNSKSLVAAESVADINPDVNIEGLVENISSPKKSEMTGRRWMQQDCLLSAVDNVKARHEIDQISVRYKKDVVDAGTLGIKGSTQVILADMTEIYGEREDPQETSVPLCTLKHFPYKREHAVEWSLNEFKELFEIVPSMLLNTGEIEEITKELSTSLEIIIFMIITVPDSIGNIAKIAAWHACKYFYTNIRKITMLYPRDKINPKTNEPYWQFPRIFPMHIALSEVPKEFFTAFVRVFLQMRPRDSNDKILCATEEEIENTVEKVCTEELFRKITELADREIDSYKEKGCESTKLPFQLEHSGLSRDQILSAVRMLVNMKMQQVSYEKDDDENGHVDFLYQMTNLRARNYELESSDRLYVRGKSGRIVPAIATTTSVISGLAINEVVKVLIYRKLVGAGKLASPKSEKETELVLDFFRNSYINLAMQVFVFSSPALLMHYEETVGEKTVEYTLWERYELRDPTVREVIEFFEKTYGGEVKTLYAEEIIVRIHDESILDKKISEVYWSKQYSDLTYTEFLERIIVISVDAEIGNCELTPVSVAVLLDDN